jgi:hypothetical protein
VFRGRPLPTTSSKKMLKIFAFHNSIWLPHPG